MNVSYTGGDSPRSFLRPFLSQVIPSLISLLAVSSATIVDGIFIGRFIGSQALAAANLLAPLFTFCFGLTLVFGIGGSVKAGYHLGAGQDDMARSDFTHSLLTVTVMIVLLSCVFLAGRYPLYSMLGSSEELLPLMNDYFRVLMPFYVIKGMIVVLYFFIRLDHHQNVVALAFVSAAVVNIGGNYLFIVELDMGMAGVAWATVISELTCLILILVVYSGSGGRRFSLQRCRFSPRTLRDFAYNGASEFMNEISIAISALVLNLILIARLGSDGLAAIAVYNFSLQLVFMFYFSISHAGQTLISRQHGAGHYSGIRQLLGYTLYSSLTVGVCWILLLYFRNDLVQALFLGKSSVQARELTAHLFSMLWPVIGLAGLNICITSYLTAVSKPLPSMVIAITRSLLLRVVLLGIFAMLAAGDTFLYALPLTESLTLMLALVYLVRNRPENLQPVAGGGIPGTPRRGSPVGAG